MEEFVWVFPFQRIMLRFRFEAGFPQSEGSLLMLRCCEVAAKFAFGKFRLCTEVVKAWDLWQRRIWTNPQNS